MQRYSNLPFVLLISIAIIAGCSSSKPADIAVVTGGVVENLGESVNSAWDDYAPAVTANGTLFFTSRRLTPKRLDYMDDVYRVNHTKDPGMLGDLGPRWLCRNLCHSTFAVVSPAMIRTFHTTIDHFTGRQRGTTVNTNIA